MPKQIIDTVEFDLPDELDKKYKVSKKDINTPSKGKDKQINWLIKFSFKDKKTNHEVLGDIGTYTVIIPKMGSTLWYYNRELKQINFTVKEGGKKAAVTLNAGDPALGWT